jgi:hypothetical protein
VSVQGYGGEMEPMSDNELSSARSTDPLCKCGLKTSSWTSFTLENFGRRFFSCVNYKVRSIC